MSDSRPPTPDEVSASHALATRLGNAQTRARRKTVRYDQRPSGGLLDHRRAMHYEAQESAGVAPTATPYGHTTWRREIDPPLRVGVVFDVSGSMQGLAAFGSSFTWVLRAACKKVDAEIAGTFFGRATEYGVLMKGHRVPPQVPYVPCWGGTDCGRSAIMLADAGLRLSSDRNGVRVLIILSDGGLDGQTFEVGEYLDGLAEDGVIVLWVTSGDDDEDRYMGRRRIRVDGLTDTTVPLPQRINALATVLVKALEAA